MVDRSMVPTLTELLLPRSAALFAVAKQNINSPTSYDTKLGSQQLCGDLKLMHNVHTYANTQVVSMLRLCIRLFKP